MNALKEIRFDRNEFAGSFGDIGTDFPLIVGMILAAGLDSSSVLIMFGAMQILTALIYRIPMPVQPLKAVATIVIVQQVPGSVIYGAGLAIGVVMLLLTLTHAIDWIARVVPKAVIRGIQFGLGVKLALLALKDYVNADGLTGYWLAVVAFFIIIFLLGSRKYPAALIVIVLGILYAFIFKIDGQQIVGAAGFRLPTVYLPTWSDMLTGFLLLSLPQIPLSIGNSILATQQIARDYFPEKKITIRKISTTYSLINLINPFFSGIPTCHGSGGMVGHYTFGGRSGGSVIIYGVFFLILGLFFSQGFDTMVHLFPLPILGVILLFEGLGLMRLVADVAGSRTDFAVALLVGIIAGGIKYGFVIGLLLGTVLFYLKERGFTGFSEKRS